MATITSPRGVHFLEVFGNDLESMRPVAQTDTLHKMQFGSSGVIKGAGLVVRTFSKGAGFTYGPDDNGPLTGTIDSFVVYGVREPPPDTLLSVADLVVDFSGAPLAVERGMFNDTDNFWSAILKRADTITLSTQTTFEFAGDGRNLLTGSKTGAADVFTITEAGRPPEPQKDVLYSGDVITVAAGATLTGGRDTFTWNGGAGTAVGDAKFVVGTLIGGDDVMRFGSATAGIVGVGDALFAGSDSGSPHSAVIIGGDDDIRGSAFDDMLVGDVLAFVGRWNGRIVGGDDYIEGGAGDDILYGDTGFGFDSLSVIPQATIIGGTDTIFGDAGNDMIDGGGGKDFLFGGADDDRLVVNRTDDVVAGEFYEGGSGTDTLVVAGSGFYDFKPVFFVGGLDDANEGAPPSIERLSFEGKGFATIEVSSSQIDRQSLATTLGVSGSTSGGQSSLSIALDTSTLDLRGFMFTNWNAGRDRVTIAGGNASETVDGSSVSDAFFAGGGDDTFFGGAGDDQFDAGSGVDTAVYTGNRADYVIVFNPSDASTRVIDVRTGTSDDTDALTGVERLRFSDGIFTQDGTLLHAATTITSNDGGASAAVTTAENTNVVTTVAVSASTIGATSTLSLSGADAAQFAISPSGVLTFQTAPNFEAPTDAGGDNVYDLIVTVVDTFGFTDSQALAVNVANVNEGPTTVALSKTSVAENQTGGTAVGALSISDPDGPTASFKLTSNPGGFFKIVGNVLQTAKALDFETAKSHVVTIEATDVTGAKTARTFTIKVSDAVDRIIGDSRDNTLNGTNGSEELSGLSGNDKLFGNAGKDILRGGADDDVLEGGAGADVIDGGAGVNTASYAGSARGVVLFLNNSASGGDAEGDRLTGIRNLIGSSQGDVFDADNADNRLEGGGGNDVLVGRGGVDTVLGGDGFDLIDMFASDVVAGETYDGGGDTDTFRLFGSSGDVFDFRDTTIVAVEAVQSFLGARLKLNAAQVNDGLKAFDVLPHAGSSFVVDIAMNGEKTLDLSTVTATGFDQPGDRFLVAGNENDETILGSSVADTIDGGAGSDTIAGGAGDDQLSGGAGIDTLSYAAFKPATGTTGIKVSLDAAGPQVTGGGQDTLSGFENVTGSLFNDTLTGNADANVLSGGAGSDTLFASLPGNGGDLYDGGAGTDVVSILRSAVQNAAFTIDLATGSDTFGNRYVGIERLVGGLSGDILRGDANANTFSSDKGNDTLMGRGGKDALDGGAGVDTADFSDKTDAVSVTLNRSVIVDVFVKGILEDRIRNIENVTGGTGDDRILGDTAVNLLQGGDGADRLLGGGAKDMLDGGTGLDTADFSDKRDAVVVALKGSILVNVSVKGVTEDRLVNIENVAGGAGDDRITGDAANNVLGGGLGADTLNGGLGTDTADYATALAGVIVSLSLGRGTAGEATGDVLTSIENLTGSAFDDTLTGNGGINRLADGAGNDRLEGALGDDVYAFSGKGLDTILDTGGIDTIEVASLSDIASSVRTGNNLVMTFASGATATVSGHLIEANKVDFVRDATRTVVLAAGSVGGNAAGILSGTTGDDVLDGRGGNDLIFGDTGNDRLIGGTGADRMAGGLGRDVYRVTDAGDTVIEVDEAGSADKVLSTISYRLGAHVENLRLTGTADSRGVGNALDNILQGNTGDNHLNGLAGSDRLAGGDGNDTFQFTSKLGQGNIDTITDFSNETGNNDRIELNALVFKAIGSHGRLAASAFKTVSDATIDADDRILYDEDTGKLSYDRDGSGTLYKAIQFAEIANGATVAAGDFMIL